MNQINLRERPIVSSHVISTVMGALPTINFIGLVGLKFAPQRLKQLTAVQQQSKLTGYVELFIEALTDEELLAVYDCIIISKFLAVNQTSKSWVDS